MAIDVFKLGWSTGGKVVLGTNPYYAQRSWSETSGVTDILTLDVLMTEGNITANRTTSVEVMSSIGEIDSNDSRIQVLLADGVQAISGTIGFSCDRSYAQNLLDWIFNKRKRSFSVYIGTENFSYVKLSSCKWNSFSVNCSEGGLLQCSISFVSNRNFEEVHPDNAFFDPIFKNSNTIPYWQTGALKDNEALKISSWSLQVSQNVTSAYLNTPDFDLPAYFRIAEWSFNLEAQMLTGLQDYNKLQLGVTSTLDPIILTAQQSINTSVNVAFGGVDAMGNYTYTIEMIGIPDNYSDSAGSSRPFSISFS